MSQPPRFRTARRAPRHALARLIRQHQLGPPTDEPHVLRNGTGIELLLHLRELGKRKRIDGGSRGDKGAVTLGLETDR